MSQFAENSIHFAADCARQSGQCTVLRENILFLDDGNELAAVDRLQSKCGYAVMIPDRASQGKSLLYHTSCDRMTDVVRQIFHDCLAPPVSLPQPASEMTVGELCRRSVALPYDDCRARVERFGFQRTSQE